MGGNVITKTRQNSTADTGKSGLGSVFRPRLHGMRLVTDYRRSERWIGLKPRTRQDYEKVMGCLLEKIGSRDVKDLTRSDVIAAKRANAHLTRFENCIPQMLVEVCEHAIDRGAMQILQRV